MVARISEKLELSDDSLRMLAAARVIPGASATVVGHGPDGVTVRTSAGEHLLPAAVAEQVYVSAAS
jgi:hypothetical protein